jgi:hypothetical protein
MMSMKMRMIVEIRRKTDYILLRPPINLLFDIGEER